MECDQCRGTTNHDGWSFALSADRECRLQVSIDKHALQPGAFATIVSVNTVTDGFSFFLRDVSKQYPVYLPAYKTIVTDADDTRGFDAIVAEIRANNKLSKLDQYASDEEESFASAAHHTRNLKCVTWLGISRDIRIFEIGTRLTSGTTDPWDWIKPRYHKRDVTVAEFGDAGIVYNYFAGRGLGCTQGLERRLEEGVLPILNTRHADEDILYEAKMFVTLENDVLRSDRVAGTHILVADHYSEASMLTASQAAEMEKLHDRQFDQEEETVLYLAINATNTATAPRYSWVRIPEANVFVNPGESTFNSHYDQNTGYGSFSADSVYLVATLDGKPVPQREMAVLLAPGDSIEYLFKIPHRPISAHRADALAQQDYADHYAACKAFWLGKIDGMASLRVPEQRIEEMMKAGKLHLDLVCYGNEPDAAVAPVVGVYSPIGSESSPIIQYLDSMGDHALARRAIMYFIEKQHDDGFMQNFGNYMLETGAVLWNIGEHYRYTKDIDWIRSIKSNILSACAYLVRWIARNEKEEFRAAGYYGMIDGKVADPEDPYHSYMLNGYAYLGLLRSAEVLADLDSDAADQIRARATTLRHNIRTALAKNLRESPVIPLGNGHWCPAAPPWAENRGPAVLLAEGDPAFTHGTFTSRDGHTGPMYLLLQEVVDPNELYGDFIVNSTVELLFLNNVMFSQPYYSPHPYAHLRRGERNAFLKEYYNNVSSLADRETYTFWEHYYQVSPHKTHEEAWFLMRSRWMLYLEHGDHLSIMPGVPRRWLTQAKSIDVSGLKSYFGTIHLHVMSDVDNGTIAISVRLSDLKRSLPDRLIVHVPHPAALPAKRVSTGTYDPDGETVLIDDFPGQVRLEVHW